MLSPRHVGEILSASEESHFPAVKRASNELPAILQNPKGAKNLPLLHICIEFISQSRKFKISRPGYA